MVHFRPSRQNLTNYGSCLTFLTRHLCSSELRDRYGFEPPPSVSLAAGKANPIKKSRKTPYCPPSSLDRTGKRPAHSDLPFDFRYSYTESSSAVRPIGLREPKYSPFGPIRLDRVWTGVCAPAVDPKVKSVEGVEDPALEVKRRLMREKIQGEPLTGPERKILVATSYRNKTKRQVNLGSEVYNLKPRRSGKRWFDDNMLNDIHNNWKHAEAVRIRCLGVPTVDMKNVCSSLRIKHLERSYIDTVVFLSYTEADTTVLKRGLVSL